MKKAMTVMLLGSMAGCLGGGGGGDFGNADGDVDPDGDADGDVDLPREYPADPYWVAGEPAGNILADMQFEGSGPEGMVSFDDAYQAWPETKALVVIGVCAT